MFTIFNRVFYGYSGFSEKELNYLCLYILRPKNTPKIIMSKAAIPIRIVIEKDFDSSPGDDTFKVLSFSERASASKAFMSCHKFVIFTSEIWRSLD